MMAEDENSGSLPDGSSWWPSGEAAAQQIEIGHRFMIARRFDRAAHYFRAAVALEPHNPDAHGRLAIALLEQGEIAEADAVSMLGTAMWPELLPLMQVRGAVLHALGRTEEGNELLQRAAYENPQMTASLGFWGGALHEQGRHHEAEVAAREVLKAEPEDWHALLLLALALVAQGQAREVVASLQRALQLAPHQSMTHAVIGACYAQSNQWPTARRFLAEALRLEAENALALHWNRVLDKAGVAPLDAAAMQDEMSYVSLPSLL